MDVTQFLDELGYPNSPGFLAVAGEDPGRISVPDYGHIFRQAASRSAAADASTPSCHLQGVYTLRSTPEEPAASIVPVVYVCKARNEAEADDIHRLVWNQDVVPFLLVHTPRGIRLYSGFRYNPRSEGPERGILRVLRSFREVDQIVEDFHAEAINGGRLWQRLGREVTPEQRLDWKLLESLRALDKWLRTRGKLEKEISHALIGKYVYLRYLKDRNILSGRKLAGWGLDAAEIFGRDAKIAAVAELTRQLETWLNGEIFPLDFHASGAPRQEHLRWIAGTFAGDEVGDRGERQLALDFKTYDFSYIPIEMLSVIYQQFLHTPEGESEKTKGRAAGAYYTPLPLVHFMLTEMEARLPLANGTTVFDPSCGSGAFLVQCYRRLIETEMARTGRSLRPRELRDLLSKNILGVDRDPDACSITELSLVLTLLDYVEPPDLESNPSFQLPALRGRNIFQGDFFNDAPWQRKLERSRRTWIVGNPPWVKLSPRKLDEEDRSAWQWMTENDDRPVGDNQVAQAFAWRVEDHLPADGDVHMGLLLPAMTLFEARSEKFRAAFFQRMKVDAVANFANLAEVLFAGRARLPAAAFFYRPRCDGDDLGATDETIATYSPLVANQEATRPVSEGTRNETWSLVVNASEMRDIPLAEVVGGDGLPWKLATWGSQLDRQLLRKLSRRFDTLGSLEKSRKLLVLSQGPELRTKHIEKGPEKTKRCDEVVGKKMLDVNRLRSVWKIFRFPARALEKNNKDGYIRRGAEDGLKICRPPHVIVNAARRFAVYSEEYLLVPSRQVGIASTSGDRLLLKALSLYLSSDFAFYHQFLTSTQFGVKRDVATLAALRAMPVPLTGLSRRDLEGWADLHDRLVTASREDLRSASTTQASLFDDSRGDFAALLEELNRMAYRALGLGPRERALVHDLVRVRLELNDGKLGEPAVRPPKREEIRRYARRLARELDAFIGGSLGKKHKVAVVYDELSAMIEVDLVQAAKSAPEVALMRADEPTAAELAETRRRLLVRRSQWVYFNRNLRIYEGTRTFVIKPMQRFHWTEGQAIFDAREIVAEVLSGGENA